MKLIEAIDLNYSFADLLTEQIRARRAACLGEDGEGKLLVDLAKHTHIHSPDGDYLHHGVDLNNLKHVAIGINAGLKGYGKNAFNNRVFIKQNTARYRSLGGDIFPLHHREVAFAHIARNFFGLKDHVPHTTSFVHPGRPDVFFTAQERVGSNARARAYFDRFFPDVADDPSSLRSEIESKLLVADTVLGQQDRHSGNFRIGAHPNKGCCGKRSHPGRPWKHLYLIDNGLSFVYPFREIAYMTKVPAYRTLDIMHPGVMRWVHDRLDPHVLGREIARMKVPEPWATGIRLALETVKSRIADHYERHGNFAGIRYDEDIRYPIYDAFEAYGL